MTNEPQTSHAAAYLRSTLDQYDDTNPPSAATVAEVKKEFNRLLDEDMEAATSDDQRKRLKALSVGGAHAFDSFAGSRSDTTLETFNDLVDIATGVRNRDGLAPQRPRTKQRTAQEDWEIARAIVAIRQGLDTSPGFEQRLRASTGMTPKAIKKIIDNMEQEKGPYENIKTNIEEITGRYSNGETWMFDGLMP